MGGGACCFALPAAPFLRAVRGVPATSGAPPTHRVGCRGDGHGRGRIPRSACGFVQPLSQILGGWCPKMLQQRPLGHGQPPAQDRRQGALCTPCAGERGHFPGHGGARAPGTPCVAEERANHQTVVCSFRTLTPTHLRRQDFPLRPGIISAIFVQLRGPCEVTAVRRMLSSCASESHTRVLHSAMLLRARQDRSPRSEAQGGCPHV